MKGGGVAVILCVFALVVSSGAAMSTGALLSPRLSNSIEPPIGHEPVGSKFPAPESDFHAEASTHARIVQSSSLVSQGAGAVSATLTSQMTPGDVLVVGCLDVAGLTVPQLSVTDAFSDNFSEDVSIGQTNGLTGDAMLSAVFTATIRTTAPIDVVNCTSTINNGDIEVDVLEVSGVGAAGVIPGVGTGNTTNLTASMETLAVPVPIDGFIYAIGGTLPTNTFGLGPNCTATPGLMSGPLEDEEYAVDGSNVSSTTFPQTCPSGFSAPLYWAEAAVALSPTYSVAFTETGLPTGTGWSVALGSASEESTTASIGYSEQNGHYAFVIGTGPESGGLVYGPNPDSGVLTVNGSPDSVLISFALVSANLLTFSERGLPIGVTWAASADLVSASDVTVAAGLTTHSRGSVTFYEPKGTVHFAIAPPAGYGVARISGTGNPSLDSGVGSPNYSPEGTAVWEVTFGPLEPLLFNQSEKPGLTVYLGASWSVSLAPALADGGPVPQYQVSRGPTIAFSVPAGAIYDFVISGPGPEYRVLPPKGELHIPAHALTKVVGFRLLAETVAFKESGLVAGATWTVTITGGSTPAFTFPLAGVTKAGDTIRFKFPVGTFTYTITNSDGQPVSPSSGSFTVASAPSPAQKIIVSFGGGGG
jgi:hypothetical protein